MRTLLAEQCRLGHFRVGELLSVAAFTSITLATIGASLAAILDAHALLRLPGWLWLLIHPAALLGAGCMAYGIFIEPYRIQVSSVRLRSRKLRSPIRIVHLSDIHVRGWSRVEEALGPRIRKLAPDIILMTGDYTTLPCSFPAVERLFREISSIAPTYASLGNCEILRPVHESTWASGVTWLLDEAATVRVGANRLSIFGVNAGDEESFRMLSERVDDASYAVCLYHYPDFVPNLARFRYDLMLCGHSHGGQIRLPWLGALVSLSRAGTGYAWGLFSAAGKAAYVGRGIGSEGYGLPRMRFGCPPEIVSLDLRP
ncbi:MAG TPA: hypothetical protein DD417_03685 [Elusimicrobia bacterium]|nr:hypothetical protein [Elusimicrobiota bacterium]